MSAAADFVLGLFLWVPGCLLLDYGLYIVRSRRRGAAVCVLGSIAVLAGYLLMLVGFLPLVWFLLH